MTMNREHTLASIAAEHNVQKRAAQNWLAKSRTDHGEIGAVINGVRRFNDSERDILLSYAREPRRYPTLDTPVEPDLTTPVITPTVIEVGNHRGQLALPTPPALIDLGQYRGEYAALTGFEPTDIERFLNSCDGFLEAVEQDYQHQRAITQQKEAVAAQVKAKVEAVKEASLVYQLRSEQLALHNATLDQALQRDMSTLGKPRQPADNPQP